MIIRKRKRREGDGPEGKRTAFAPNSPSHGPDAPCPRRRGIETSCKMPWQARMRTSSRDEHARIFCLVASPMAHNAPATLLSDRGRRNGRRIQKMALSTPALLEFCREHGVQPRLRPPRKPSPQAARTSPTFGMCGALTG